MADSDIPWSSGPPHSKRTIDLPQRRPLPYLARCSSSAWVLGIVVQRGARTQKDRGWAGALRPYARGFGGLGSGGDAARRRVSIVATSSLAVYIYCGRVLTHLQNRFLGRNPAAQRKFSPPSHPLACRRFFFARYASPPTLPPLRLRCVHGLPQSPPGARRLRFILPRRVARAPRDSSCACRRCRDCRLEPHSRSLKFLCRIIFLRLYEKFADCFCCIFSGALIRCFLDEFITSSNLLSSRVQPISCSICRRPRQATLLCILGYWIFPPCSVAAFRDCCTHPSYFTASSLSLPVFLLHQPVREATRRSA